MTTSIRFKRSRFQIDFDDSRLMDKCLTQIVGLLSYEKERGRAPWAEGKSKLFKRFAEAIRRALRAKRHLLGINLSEEEASDLHDFVWFMESCQDEVPMRVQQPVLDDETEERMLSAHWSEILFNLRAEMSNKSWW